MQETHRTEIASLGEFGLIKHLTEHIRLQNPESKYGVGDDAAVLDFAGQQTLVTTDLLMEGVHFDLVYTPMKHLGYKAAIVNFSDIYAMNGTPKQITVSLAVSKRFCIEDLELFYEGLQLACQLHGVDIVGGDTTSSVTGLAISITCLGVANQEAIVYRNGAQETDLICVSGDLGAAYMGLQLLEREKAVFEVVPFLAKRSIPVIDDKNSSKKLERWNMIAKEACEQSKRNVLVDVVEPVKLKGILDYKSELNIIAYEDMSCEGAKHLYDLLSNDYNSITIVVGPEGGFDSSEIDFLNENGFINVSLGKRILRSETAPLYMLSVISFMNERNK